MYWVKLASDKATAVDKDDQEPVPLTRIGSRKRSSSDFPATANKVTKRGKLDSPAATTKQTIIGKDTVAKENKSYRISPSSSRSKKNQKRIYEAGEDDNILKCDDKDNLRAEEPKFAGKQSFPGGRIITHNSAHSRENAENIITFLAIQTNLLTQCIRDTAEYDNHLVKGALLSTARQTLLSIEQQSKQYLAKATTELSEATSKAKWYQL